MIAEQRVIEAISRLTGVPANELTRQPTPALPLPRAMDSLDWAEAIMELEDEFDEETVRWALRYIEVLTDPPGTRRSRTPPNSRFDHADSLWDAELDGPRPSQR